MYAPTTKRLKDRQKCGLYKAYEKGVPLVYWSRACRTLEVLTNFWWPLAEKMSFQKLNMIYIKYISKQLDIKLGPFTKEELDSVLRKIKNRKAAGLDEIPPEVWKTRQFDDILLRHCNAVYNQNPIDRWTKGMHPPLP